MISFFGNYYGGLVVKNLEKVFYMICGVALVFVGIIIGGLFENNADAQNSILWNCEVKQKMCF